MDIEISPGKILVLLLSIIGFLLFANIMGLVSTYVFDHGRVYGLVELMDFDSEENIPTLYASLQLIVVSSLLSIIGAKHKSNGEIYVPWFVLAVIFLYLAVDETAQIHERLMVPVNTAFELTGLLYFAWVVPYGIGVLVFVIAFSRSLFRLPKKTIRRFILSWAIFVTGAIGFEMLGARHYESYGEGNVVFSLFYTCEELLEMLGIALFIYTLLTYVSNEFQYLKATVRG